MYYREDEEALFVMPVLAPPPAKEYFESIPFCGTDETVPSEGIEGKYIQSNFNSISDHWNQCSLTISVSSVVDTLDELTDYLHVPFRKVGRRKVKYRKVKRLEPRKIDFDGDN